MKLEQIISAIVHFNGTAFSIVDLNGVSIVEDVKWGGLIVEGNVRNIG